MSATIDDQRERLARALDPNVPPDTRMRTKVLAEVDAIVEKEGTFEALVASFGNIDAHGDRIVKGAFTNTLNEWRASGRRIPVVFSHQTQTPAMIIGSADPAQSHETDEGLVVHGKLNIFTSATAQHVHELLANGDISGWSFGFQPVRSRKARDATELLELRLLELGPTVAPANTLARTIGVKGEPVPEPEPDEMSHDEIEQALIDRGLLPPITEDTIRIDARDHIRGILNHRRDGEEHDHEDEKAIDARRKSTEVKIASFDC